MSLPNLKMSLDQQREVSDDEVLEMDLDQVSRDSWNEIMNREKITEENTGVSQESYANIVCKNLTTRRRITPAKPETFEVPNETLDTEDEHSSTKRTQRSRVYSRRSYGQGARSRFSERTTLRDHMYGNFRNDDSREKSMRLESDGGQWLKFNNKHQMRSQERFNRRPYGNGRVNRTEQNKSRNQEVSQSQRRDAAQETDQWYKQPVAVPFPPPLFERLLSNQTSLSRLQREEIIVNPLNSLNVKDAYKGVTSFTMFLLTHGKVNLTYSYKNVSLYEKDLVGVSLFTKCFPFSGNAEVAPSNGNIHGLIFRKYQNERISYEDYQERLNSLVVRDKFFNERNLAKLQYQQTTHCPLDALRVLKDHSSDSTLYSVCEIPLSAHMLSVAFPTMLEYLRSRDVRIIGHRLSPRLTWIANAFADYCSSNDFEIKAIKLNLTNCNKIPISPDCYSRDNHNSSTCEVCVFHNYSHAFQRLMRDATAV